MAVGVPRWGLKLIDSSTSIVLCWKCCSACWFILFHESMEVMKDISLMHGDENGKLEGYGNERKFFVECFLLFKDNAECFSFLLFP